MTCCKCCFSSHTEKKWTRPPPSMLLQSQLKYLFKLQFTAIYKSSPYHWSPRASTPVSSLSEEKLSHGSLRTRLFNSSLHFLTKGNILILSLIPQDFKKKNNFVITSLLEPCLIIPNYAARHLVLSVGPTRLRAHHRLAARCVCVCSRLRITRECVPSSSSALFSFNNTARNCPGGSVLCASGLSLFSPIFHAVYPNMQQTVGGGVLEGLNSVNRYSSSLQLLVRSSVFRWF